MKRISLRQAATLAFALIAAACGGTTTANSGAPAPDPACMPSDDVPTTELPPASEDRRIETITELVAGSDLDVVAAQHPNYGGVYGDFEGGVVVAVLDCSLVDADRLATIAGGADRLHLIEVEHTFAEINAFRDRLLDEAERDDVAVSVSIDSTLTGRLINVHVPNLADHPTDFGSDIPATAFVVTAPDPPDPSLSEQELLFDSDDRACRNEGTVIAGGTTWHLADPVPFGRRFTSPVRGMVEPGERADLAVFVADDGTRLTVTTGDLQLECYGWDDDEDTDVDPGPPQQIDRLSCAPGIVVEQRTPDTGAEPQAIMAPFTDDVTSVESGRPLWWWGLDAEGTVIIGIALGDAPGADYQVFTCSD